MLIPYDTHYEWIKQQCSSGEGNLLVHTQDGIRDNQLSFLIKHIVTICPKKVLEIGTNCCCFGYMLKHIAPQAQLITLGIDTWSKNFVDYLNNAYGNYIDFICGDSQVTMPQIHIDNIDLAWVDGCHHQTCLTSDLNECARLNIKHILIDDYEYSPVNEGVQKFLINYPNYFIKDHLNDHRRDIVYLESK